jgi:hypothetical protein
LARALVRSTGMTAPYGFGPMAIRHGIAAASCRPPLTLSGRQVKKKSDEEPAFCLHSDHHRAGR